MEYQITMDDFFPPRPITMEDFYPGGTECYFRPKPLPTRRANPEAVAVLIALAERLKQGAEAAIELLTIMEFCHRLLATEGVKLRIVPEDEYSKQLTTQMGVVV
jgi:hypothetical protein